MSTWRFWARPDQLPPPDAEWITWLALAGRGWGKTRVGAETTIEYVRSGTAGRCALVGETAADVRDVMIEGDSGILRSSPRDFRPIYEPSKRKLTWPNGAIAQCYNATEPDQLRGPQFHFAWCDEIAKWQYAQESWDNLQFGLRLGTQPRQIVTTTPRPIPLVRALIKDPTTRTTRGRTLDNRDNLAGSFLRQVITRYEGTRLGRQELEAEVLDDVPGALWSRAMLDRARHRGELPELVRICVAVDPSGQSGDDDTADEIGIVAAGLGIDGRYYVLQDASCSGGPAEWGRIAVDLYHRLGADLIVAEINYGGAMVEHVLRTIDPAIAFRKMVASRGKAIRAEPIAALYEQDRASHCGSFPMLEDQMCQLTTTEYLGGGSPDRLDAMVWALTELSGGSRRRRLGIA